MFKTIAVHPDAAVAGTGPQSPSVPWALAGLSLSMLLSSLDTSIANVALPTLAGAFHASFQEVQWVVLSYLLAVTTLIVSVGRLGDIVGNRRLLLAGIALFTAASALCSFAPTLGLLIAGRAAQGLGGAVMMALTMALVGETVPKARIGGAMGLIGTMSAVGTALGPSLGGLLIAGPGWRAVFLVNVPLGILTFLLTQRHLPADRRNSQKQPAGFDHAGTLLLGLTLGAYALAVTLGHGRFGPLNAALLLGAVGGAGLFVFAEMKAPAPLIQWSLVRDRALRAGLVTGALVTTVVTTTLVVGPFYLSRALGLDAARVGLVLSVGPLVAALTGWPAGRMADRFGARRMTLIGLIGMAAGSVLLAVAPASLGLPGYIVPIAVITAGYGFFQTANNTAVLTDVRPDQRGVVSGLLNLSRNLGRITGASAMGAMFAFASAATDITQASPEAVATGLRVTFAVAAILSAVALVLAAGRRGVDARSPGAAVAVLLTFGALAGIGPIQGRAATAGRTAPTPADPYPLSAAGWGPPAGNSGQFVCRWVEDWTKLRATDQAPPLKAIPLGSAAYLSLSAEIRARQDRYTNGQLQRGNDYTQGLFRGILGADLRINPHLRAYGEAGTGRVEGRRGAASANFENIASLQQLFVDFSDRVGPNLVGVMVGRQEFTDGPRQLLSVSDGPNLHRTWNGVRLYAHGRKLRLGAFDLRVTRPGRGSFDEDINRAERLQGLNASLVLPPGPQGASAYFDPFWFHTENPAFRSGGRIGRDRRDTCGVRLWSRRGDLSFDWTLARQTGRFQHHDVEAWGLFAVQSLALSARGWKPRLGAHLDLASGGGAYGADTLRGFNPLYASSNYLGEGLFLSASNLLLIAPGVSVTPTTTTSLSLEYGFARRLNPRDAAYAGLMRTYAGTQNVPGREIGGLLRITGAWSVTAHLTLFCDYEHLAAGEVLRRAGLPSASYGHLGATFRY